ncbi:MAG: DegQ family serine endoprotease [Deltaproteobacteria bacterium]|jgi:serine protease Do|nr:DegQ family serine endoprotease [Deltaproteobacteria bacterium]
MIHFHKSKIIGSLVIVLAAGFIWGLSSLESKTAAKNTPATDSGSMMVPASFSELAKQAQPGVVNIRTVKTVEGGGRVFQHFFGNPFERKNPFDDFGPFSDDRGPDFKQRSLGSGFIIDREGHIVTNNHVIEGADEITVRLSNEKEYDAEIVGRDPNTDLALIKIKGAADLVPLKMGDSDQLTVGSWVVAMGSPFGLEQTVTAGIVSAKGRVIGSGPYDDFIQTDASINPGNSGGPLLNMNGEVVGINTAIVAQGQGIGFAIPVNLAQGIIRQLEESGSVTRGWLGVGIQDLTPELAEYYGIKDKKGVLVAKVFEGDPADKAGIKANDIIIAVDGKPVSTSRDLTGTIANIPVGKNTPITILRDGKEKTVKVKIAKRDDSEQQARREPEQNDQLGIQIAEMTPEMAKRFGHSETEKGVLVVGVESGSKAAESGLRQGDLVKEVNRKPVTAVSELRAELKKNDKIQLLVKRPNAGFIVIKIG